MSAQWYHLGLQLKVKTGTLDSISMQFSRPRDQLLEMLKTWLTTANDPSWQTLIDALGKDSVGASQLGRRLEAKYCNVERPEGDRGMSAYDSLSKNNVFPPSPVSEPRLIVITQQTNMQESIHKSKEHLHSTRDFFLPSLQVPLLPLPLFLPVLLENLLL